MALFGKPPVLVRLEANVPWEVFRHPKTGAWIGACQPLNLTAIGDTWNEFQEAAGEAIEMLLTDLLKTGELETFLRRNKWTSHSALPQRDTPVRWDVPFQVTQRSRFEDLVPA